LQIPSEKYKTQTIVYRCLSSRGRLFSIHNWYNGVCWTLLNAPANIHWQHTYEYRSVLWRKWRITFYTSRAWISATNLIKIRRIHTVIQLTDESLQINEFVSDSP